MLNKYITLNFELALRNSAIQKMKKMSNENNGLGKMELSVIAEIPR